MVRISLVAAIGGHFVHTVAVYQLVAVDVRTSRTVHHPLPAIRKQIAPPPPQSRRAANIRRRAAAMMDAMVIWGTRCRVLQAGRSGLRLGGAGGGAALGSR
jgi:hypothetical protein